MVWNCYIGQEAQLSAVLQPIREMQQEQKKMMAMCTAVAELQKKVLTAIEELKQLIIEQTKKKSPRGAPSR